ncbi:MAG: adenosine deaminase, partial [Myxococcales bacterium]|nr:adenosine deaminase [Deltaproteobacteria bacterium]NNL23325.1 adenosine deaminase [Myxococcales bacterium]
VKDLRTHPLKLYHDLGLRVTINTDNRLIADTTVSRELWLCHSWMGMDRDDVHRMIINGFKAAFLPFHQKQTMVRTVIRELSNAAPVSAQPGSHPADANA